jgi:DNA-binding Xre family transcriptional regulator
MMPLTSLSQLFTIILKVSMKEGPMTLRDIWISKGMTSTQVAAAARCSIPTLYKMNRREEQGVAFGIIKRVCAVLGLTLDEFDRLEACPMADRYRGQP